MFEYARKWIESTLGRGLLAVGGVFAAGAGAMAKLPDFVVSPATLRSSVDSVQLDVEKVRVAQERSQRALEAQVISLRIDLLKQQKRQLEAKSPKTPQDNSALKELEDDINDLRKKLDGAQSGGKS